MLTLIKTTYHGLAAVLARGGPTVSKKEFNEWLQNSYIVTLLHWHEKMRPKHFQETATAEYGYLDRKATYEDRKREQQGHTRPLVWSGDSERATERFQVRATSKSGRLSMDAGNLTFTPKNKKVPMRDELTVVTAEEERKLADIMDRDIARQMRGDNSLLTRITQ